MIATPYAPMVSMIGTPTRWSYIQLSSEPSGCSITSSQSLTIG